MIRTPSARQKSDVVIKMETLDEGSISHQAGSSEQERMSLLDADEAAVSTPRQSSGQQLLGTLERRKTKFDEKQYRSLSVRSTAGEITGISSMNQSDTTDNRELEYRWFFIQTEETSHARHFTTSSTNSASPSVDVLLSQLKIKHTLSGGQIPSGHYYVTLSISLDRMDPSYIEDIKFTYTSGNTTKEIQLSASELKGLEQKSDQRIRIHYGLDIQTHHDCSIDIAISFKDNASKTPSTIRLNYLELIDAYSQLPSKDDYVVFGSELVNSPTSIQVCQEDSEMSEQPVQIKAICVSNSEKHIATLSMDSGDAIVKVWSLESEETDENKGKKENFDCTLTKRITLASQDLAKYPNISLALSEDGTDVVVCQAPSDGELISLEEDLIGFNGSPIKRMGPVRRKFFSFLSRKVNNPITTCLGYGKFMVPSSNEELFLQTDGNSILIHQIRPIWTIVFCFALSNTIPPTWGTVKSCIESANGPYFAWVGDRRAVSIWRVDRGLMVSFIPTSHFHQDSKLLSSEKSVARAKYQQPRCNITRFSCCGRAVAVVNGYKVHVFLMPSATEAKVLDTRALGSNITIVDVIWAKSLPKLSVLFRDNNEHKEYLVSFSDGNVVWSEERSVCSGAFATPHVTNTRTYTTHGSTLDICDIEALRKTRTFGPSLPEINTKGCRQNLGSPIAGKSECDMDNGMSFRIEADETSGVSELVMVAPNGARRTYLRFPITSESLRDDQNGKSNTGPILKASFLNCNTRFVVSGADIVMVWKLPSDQDGQCELIAVKKTDFDPVESAGTSAHDRWLNQELKINNVISSIDTEPLKSTDYINIQECEKAFPELVKFYTDSIISTENWKDWQEALLRYVSRHLTSCSAWDNSSNMFLRKLCQTWELDGYEQRIALLLSDLLLSQDLNVRWLPASASNPDNNPIYYALELYRDHYHRSPTLHSILIDHCFKNTRQLNDIFYLTPVLSCSQLLTLIDKDLALDISRRVAYIPVKDQEDYRSFILDNATDYRGPLNFNIEINFPIRVHYGKDGIYSSRRELEKPSLRLCTPQALNHQAKYFKGKLYIAPISVLWTIQQLEPEKAITETHVHGHNFSLEAFDNPAIEAALEYKWRKEQGTFWFALIMRTMFTTIPIIIFSKQGAVPVEEGPVPDRSLKYYPAEIIGICIIGFQLAYYILYGMFLRLASYIKVFFILGIIMAMFIYIFIILTSIHRSIQSLALAFVVTYIMIIDTLRSFKRVSRFFSFIFRLAREIGLFLMMFTLGILAFTHVFWILLRGCLGLCAVSTSIFPSNFFKATFATLFFLAGRYDAVSDEMDGDNYTFLFVMTLYYLFSAIIMLNVLIGLVNVALAQVIDTNDNEWLLTWLQSRYLSLLFNAKWNATHAPVLEPWTYGRYSREVYYTATDEEIGLYNQKYFPDGHSDMLEQDRSPPKEICDFPNPSDSFEKDRQSRQKSGEDIKIDRLQGDIDEVKSILQKDLDEMKSVLALLLAEKRQ